MPTDDGTCDCVEEYVDVCTKTDVLFSEPEATFLIVIGDFNNVSTVCHLDFVTVSLGQCVIII